MKRLLLYLSLAFLPAVITGCSGSAERQAPESTAGEADSVPALIDSDRADTLARALGVLSGSRSAQEKSRLVSKDRAADYDNGKFIEGFNVAMTAGTPSESYTAGVKAASDMISTLQELKNSFGISIDRRVLLEALEQGLMADSVDRNMIQNANTDYNELLLRLYASSPH